MCLLGFAPLLNEEDVGADSKVEFVVFVLSVFVRTLSNVALVNRDNVSTKIKIARILANPHRMCFAIVLIWLLRNTLKIMSK